MTALKMTSVNFFNSWYSRMFLEAVPFSFALRVFDVYMHQGCEVHFRVALALLREQRDRLMTCKTEAEFLAHLVDGTRNLTVPAKVLDKAWKYKTSSTVAAWDKQRGKVAKKQVMAGPSKPAAVAVHAPKSSDAATSSATTSTPKLRVFYPTLDFKSKIMAPSDWNFIYNWMPMRFTIRDPILLHSMSQEGTSLQHIYKTLSNYEPTLVVVKTKQERVRFAKRSRDGERLRDRVKKCQASLSHQPIRISSHYTAIQLDWISAKCGLEIF